MEYRRLTADDATLVINMNRDFRVGFAEENSVKAFLCDPDCWLFAAVTEDRIIGFAYGYALRRLNTQRKMLYIHEVGVMEEYQRQGIGTRLMEALRKDCEAKQICKMFLTCYENNAGANALYRRAGGQYCAESQGRDTVYWFPIP